MHGLREHTRGTAERMADQHACSPRLSVTAVDGIAKPQENGVAQHLQVCAVGQRERDRAGYPLSTSAHNSSSSAAPETRRAAGGTLSIIRESARGGR